MSGMKKAASKSSIPRPLKKLFVKRLRRYTSRGLIVEKTARHKKTCSKQKNISVITKTIWTDRWKIIGDYQYDWLMKDWISRLHLRISETANTKPGIFILFICAMADASFLPLPVTTLFLFLILLDLRLIHKYVFFVVLGTLSGAIAGYLIGHYAWLKPDGEFTGAIWPAHINDHNQSGDKRGAQHHWRLPVVQ